MATPKPTAVTRKARNGISDAFKPTYNDFTPKPSGSGATHVPYYVDQREGLGFGDEMQPGTAYHTFTDMLGTDIAYTGDQARMPLGSWNRTGENARGYGFSGNPDLVSTDNMFDNYVIGQGGPQTANPYHEPSIDAANKLANTPFMLEDFNGIDAANRMNSAFPVRGIGHGEQEYRDDFHPGTMVLSQSMADGNIPFDPGQPAMYETLMNELTDAPLSQQPRKPNWDNDLVQPIESSHIIKSVIPTMEQLLDYYANEDEYRKHPSNSPQLREYNPDSYTERNLADAIMGNKWTPNETRYAEELGYDRNSDIDNIPIARIPDYYWTNGTNAYDALPIASRIGGLRSNVLPILDSLPREAVAQARWSADQDWINDLVSGNQIEDKARQAFMNAYGNGPTELHESIEDNMNVGRRVHAASRDRGNGNG